MEVSLPNLLRTSQTSESVPHNAPKLPKPQPLHHPRRTIAGGELHLAGVPAPAVPPTPAIPNPIRRHKQVALSSPMPLSFFPLPAGEEDCRISAGQYLPRHGNPVKDLNVLIEFILGTRL